jgi:hypothetical protein
MRRGVHIVVALLLFLLLIRPFDCFAGGKFDQKAADCCRKGKCSPSNSDECCKGTVPDGNQFSAPKAPDNLTPLHAVITALAPVIMAVLSIASPFDESHAPTGSPPDSRLNLPLLI